MSPRTLRCNAEMRRNAFASLVLVGLAVTCLAAWAAYRFVLIPLSASAWIGPELAEPVRSLQGAVEVALLVGAGICGWAALVAYWVGGRHVGKRGSLGLRRPMSDESRRNQRSRP
jgi:hypothetical protein